MTHAGSDLARSVRPAIGPTGICMLTGELPPDRGGVGDYTARLSDALAALGTPIGILTRRRPGIPSRRVLGDCSVPVHGTIDRWGPRAFPRITRALSRLGSRPLLHIQFQAGAFDLGGSVHLLPSLLRATLPRARVVTTFHDFLVPYLFPRAGPVRLAANRLLARSSHAAIFTDLTDLELAGPGVHGRVVPIGSNVDRVTAAEPSQAEVRRQLGADDETFVVGYFGFLNPSKGVPTLLEAIGQVAARRPGQNVRLVLIGAEAGVSNPTDLTQARAVHDAIEHERLGQLIVRTGYLPPPELSATLLACDVVALPFRDGASARRGTLMAALAHALPIVSTLPARRSPLAGPPAFWLGAGPGAVAVRDGESILLVPPDDADALATALLHLAEDPALRTRLAEGTVAAADRIAWPTLAAETLEIYRAVFAGDAS